MMESPSAVALKTAQRNTIGKREKSKRRLNDAK
jgi:hypothetical protein